MSVHPVIVERIDDEQSGMSIPDTRGTWHHIQLDNEDLLKLHRKIQARLTNIEVEDMRTKEMAISSEDQYELWLHNFEEQWFRYACVGSVDHGRALWKLVGAHGVNLITFQVRLDNEVMYEGNYITDEC